MSRLIATFFYIGLLRPAPGSWGSLAATLCAWPLIVFAGWGVLIMATCAVFAVGLWATGHEAGPEDHDPSRIVIDEVAGQWITLVPLAWLYTALSEPRELLFIGLGVGFALFRLFDIWKPWPVSLADARKDAWGVMLDDVVAGVLAAIVMALGLIILSVLAVGAAFG